jgi:hypothetical protein
VGVCQKSTNFETEKTDFLPEIILKQNNNYETYPFIIRPRGTHRNNECSP